MLNIYEVTDASVAIGAAVLTASAVGFVAAGVVALFVMLSERVVALCRDPLEIERLRTEVQQLRAAVPRPVLQFDPKNGTPHCTDA